MESKIKHLEMLTSIIERMASYSFMLKGWGITIVAGMFALAGKEMNQSYLIFAYVPLVTFWFLDSYYLQLERKYKALYKDVRIKAEDEIDFNMDIGEIQFINTNKRSKYFNCLFSMTEWIFYIPIIVVIAFILNIK